MSRNRRALAVIASALAVVAIFVVSLRSAQAVTLTFSQNPNPFQAVEGTTGIISFITVTTDSFISITGISLGGAPGPLHTGGDFDDMAKNLVLKSPTTFPFGPIAAGGNFSIVFSWDAVDTSGINDQNFGDWVDSFGVGWSSGGTVGGSGGSVFLRVIDPVVPLPAALPLFGTGLGVLGLLGWWRKRKIAAVAA